MIKFIKNNNTITNSINNSDKNNKSKFYAFKKIK